MVCANKPIPRRYIRAKKHSTKRKAAQAKLRKLRRQQVNYFEVPKPLWKRIKHIFPRQKRRKDRGRPPLPNRLVLNAIWYVLWAGCPWKALPHRQFGVSSRRRGEPDPDPCPIPGEARHPAWRWVVERTFSWLAKRRSIRTRWCKKAVSSANSISIGVLVVNLAVELDNRQIGDRAPLPQPWTGQSPSLEISRPRMLQWDVDGNSSPNRSRWMERPRASWDVL